MPLLEMGELLRQGRLKRSLSVEDVASQLKISPRLIRDLEAGNEPSLPHAVYVRGFIKSYARLLDIAPDQLAAGLAVYEHIDQDMQAPPRVTPVRPRPSWGLLILPLLCAIAFAAYWYYNTYMAASRAGVTYEALSTNNIGSTAPVPVTPPAAAGEQSSAASPPASQSAPRSEASPAPAASGQAGQSPQSGQTGQPLPTAPAGQSGAASSSAVAAPGDATAEEAPVRARGFAPPERETPVPGSTQGTTVRLGIPGQTEGRGVNHLVLISQAECWVHATADDTETRQFSLKSGETFSLSFGKSLVLKLGNAGGVRLKYNGKDLPSPGKVGQVLTLRFPGAEGG